jgi:hypothetical protein
MDLQTFNAWGMVSVSGNQVTVILSAIYKDGQPMHRTLKEDANIPLETTGSALIAISLDKKGYHMGVHELSRQKIADHPEVLRVLKKAVDWLKSSL